MYISLYCIFENDVHIVAKLKQKQENRKKGKQQTGKEARA
jgi:hypothetical protein